MIDLSRKFSLRAVARIAFVTSSLCLAASASAHDFWLEPEQFQVDPQTTQTVNVRIGHPSDRSAWSLQPERLIGVRALGPTGLTDQHQYYSPGDEALTFIPEDEGLHWVLIETQNSISELPAEAFNDYIKKEHLTAIQTDRIRQRETDLPGVERYSRRGKALVGVGDWMAASMDHVTQPLGLTLEIIPMENPLLLQAGEALPLEVRYRGQPLAGAQIKVIRLDEEVKPGEVLTDEAGRASVSRPAEGRWMYHVIWGTPLSESYPQDFDTIFSSMTFEVPKG